MGSLAQRVPLGRTGLSVSRLGLGASYGVSRRGCLEAFDAGVNYLFWGSTRTRGMGLGIRELGRRPGIREQMVVVLQCYVRWPSLVSRSVERGLRSLGLDYADVLLLGWHDRHPSTAVLEAAERLRERGRFRHLAISSHQRRLIAEWLPEERYDAFHLRYNAAHRGAEQEIFPHLPVADGPGIVSFTNTRWGHLLDPAKMPAGTAPPTAADCYRFVLSHPAVHVAICGPAGDDQLRHGLSVLESNSMDDEELARMRAIGDHVHGLRTLSSWLM